MAEMLSKIEKDRLQKIPKATPKKLTTIREQKFENKEPDSYEFIKMGVPLKKITSDMAM